MQGGGPDRGFHGRAQSTRERVETHSFSDPLAPKEHVHFLQRQPLRLRYEEPDESPTSKSQDSEEDEGPKGDLLQHDRRDLADDEVRHPIRRRTKSNAVSAIGQRPDFADDDLTARPPAVSEVDDEKPNHRDGRPTRSLMSGPLMLVDTEEDGDDCMTDTHGNGSCKQDGFSAKLINVEDGRNGGEEHGYAHYACCKKAGGVTRGAQRFEDGRGVVED